MYFCPAKTSHTPRQYLKANVLTSTPTVINVGDLHAGHTHIRDRGKASSCIARLETTDDTVNDVDRNRHPHVRCCSGGVHADRSEETEDGNHVRDEEDVVVGVAPERGGEEGEDVDADEADCNASHGGFPHVFPDGTLDSPFVD